MEATREEKLARLEKLKRLQMLKGERAAKDTGTTLAGLGQSFNKGVVDLINLPSELLNIPLSLMGAPQIPTEGFRQKTADMGITAQPGQEEQGFLNRSAEILGASVLPSAAIMAKGAQVLKAGIPAAERTVVQNLTATTAANPASAAAVDVLSSGGAGLGGEVASNMTDDPNLILLGELAGGFTLPAFTAVSRVVGKPGVDKIRETMTPFTKAGAEPRAARRLQSLSTDPQAEAKAIDAASPVSPARQTGNPRLIALERAVLDQNPELEKKFTKELSGALDAAKQQAAVFGGKDRTRQILEKGQDHLVNLVNLRAAKAAQTAQAKIDDLGGAASPRDISRIARSHLDSALKDVRFEETKLWERINKDAPGSFSNTRNALGEVSAQTGELVPSKIPAWVSKAANTTKDVTFNDLKQVRSRVLSDAREASNGGDFDKSRVLNNVSDGLLADMSAVNDPNVATARAFSRALNQNFTEGAVADLLNRGANRGAGIAAEDTLQKLFTGASPATRVRAFIDASPQADPQIQQFMKTGLARAATKNGQFNEVRTQAHIDKLEAQGMFDIFPDMKAQMTEVQALFKKSGELAQRAKTVTDRGGARLLRDNNKSLAGALLNSEPGQEMATLMRSENPEAMAGVLKRRMGGDKSAINGLKTSFAEELFNQASKTGSTGEIEISGQKLAKTLNDNIGAAKALGMDDSEITRMKVIARQLIQSQTTGGAQEGAILTDTPAELLTFVAQLAGAKAGQRIAGGGLGSSMVIAGKGSAWAQRILQKLTTNEAQKLLIDAQSDPVLYKALLTKQTSKPKEIFDSTRVIESWIIGAGVEGRNERMTIEIKNGRPATEEDK